MMTKSFSRAWMKTLSLLSGVAKTPLMIGGQAVMEGVMMKSKGDLATAVRKPDGKIEVRHVTGESFATRSGIAKVPLLRGAVILFETMIIGAKELNWSANQGIEEEEDQLGTWELVLTFVISIIFALALFKLVPLLIASFITAKAAGGNWMLNILDGVIKFCFFIGYLVLLGLMPDVKRLFQYHGAEHKSVNCYEAGKKLTPRNAKRFTMKQARCGTTFLVYVILLSIVLYLFIPFGTSFWTKYFGRILLLPVIAGIVYEWTRFSGKWYSKNKFVRFLSAPGMAVQSLTTKEPDLKQLAVGITALERVLKAERRKA